MQKAKRDDFRLEEELRTAKAKYEEANEDVFRRMQDIKDAEADSVSDLTRFLDVELDYHERCAEALRQKRAQWTGVAGGLSPSDSYGRDNTAARRPSGRSRSNTAQSGYGGGSSSSFGRTNSHVSDYGADPRYEEPEDLMPPQRVPIRSHSRVSVNSAASSSSHAHAPAQAPATIRPAVSRASTFHGDRALSRTPSHTLSVVPPPPSQSQLQPTHSQASISSLRGQLRPTGGRPSAMDVFADNDDDTASSDTPPGSASPATSYGSSSRTNITSSSNGGGGGGGYVAGKKAPPPPPSRAKKPPPPVPNRREREV